MTAIYIILGVVLIALIVLVVMLLLKRKKQAAAGGAVDESGGAGNEEIDLLIRDADSRIAAAKLGAGARVASLPVFILMGDSGSTKTSVILHSGLEPELVAGQVYQNDNVVPTRAANLWFSRRMMFVEAGGKLLTEPAKWNRLVRKLEPRSSVGKSDQAPRAAIVFFDCETFTKPGALDMAVSQARNLRTRLVEISQAMGINLPVYVLFTKLDRLPFFTDFVRNLSNEEASQVLGVTLPMVTRRSEGVYAEEETARLTTNFERLFRALADARPEFLARETDGTKLPPSYEFPREFRKLRPALVQFLVDLCRPSQLTVAPFLRGFYFTGVRPVIINEAAPVAAAQPQAQAGYGSVAGATGIFRPGGAGAAPKAATPPVATTRKVPQWLFLSHLFNDILLADRAAMGASGSSTKTSKSRRILFASAAALCFVLLVLFTISFFNNRSLETTAGDAVHAIAPTEAAGADLASNDSLRRLETIRQSLEKLGKYHREGAPLFYRWGLYIGDDLYPEVRRAYFDRFRQLLFGQTRDGIVQYLSKLPATPGPDYGPTYDALKAYLITTSFHDKSTKMFLTPVLLKWWGNGRAVDPDRQQLAQKQFDFYADELKIENPFSKENDGLTIERARRYLAQFAGADRVYAFMLSEANKNPSINFNRQYPGSAQVVVETHEVPGAFSKSGWAFMKDAMAHADRYFSGEQWVLGDQASANIDRGKLEQDLKTRYYTDFVNQWRAYVKSAAVVRYADLKDAAQKLQQLSGNTSPLLELVALGSTNTAVDDANVAAIFQPMQAVVPPGSTDRVIAPPNQSYMNALLTLQSSLEGIANQAGTVDPAAAAPTISNAAQAKVTTRQMAQGFRADPDGHVDSSVQKLLEDPIVNVEEKLRLLGPTELNAKGKAMCGQIRPVLAKFPFSPLSQQQATMQEVDSVFKPKEGAIWQFYDANLQKVLTRNGSQFVPNSAGGLQVTAAFLGFMNRVAAFSDAAWAGGAGDPQLKYSVKPVVTPDTEKISLTIDGQALVYSGGAPAPKAFTWPGAAHGVQLTVKYKGTPDFTYGSYDGLWGVFQFVNDADKRQGPLMEMTLRSGRSGQAVKKAGTNETVTARFEITATPPVFDKGYFAGFTCVSEVAR